MTASERTGSGPGQEPGNELAAPAGQPDGLVPEGRTLRRRLAAPLAGVSRRRARVTALRSRAGGAGSRAAGAGARAAGRGARAAGRGARWGIQRLVDEVLIRAPRL